MDGKEKNEYSRQGKSFMQRQRKAQGEQPGPKWRSADKTGQVG